MQRLDYFNRMLPVMQDFLTSEELSGDSTRARWQDRSSWGVVRRNSFITPLVIPVSPTADVPRNPWDILEFPIVFDTENGKISVGAGSTTSSNPKVTGGVAYDVNGERIPIEDDATFDFSNDIPQGKKSSGNIEIPLTLTGTVGGCAVNPSQFGTYYVWIEYLEVNDPLYSRVAKDGSIHYPRILDGYRIRLTGTPVAPSGDGVSVFLGKVVWAVSFPGSLTVVDGTADQDGNGNLVTTVTTPAVTGGDPSRVYSMVRDRQLEIEIDTVNERTQVYATGLRLSVHDHVNAIGSAAPSPTNPHGLTLLDIPGGTTEPKATINFKEGLHKGIVDLALDNNSPVVQTSAALCTLVQAPLIPSGLDVTAIVGTGVNSALQERWVRVSDLGANQSVFVAGTRLKRLYPTLRQTTNWTFDPSINTTDPDSGDGWVGFSSEPGFLDAAGTYRIFGQLGSVGGTDVLFLRKQLLDDFSWNTPALGLDEIELAVVYWDGAIIWTDYLRAADILPVERRSAGLVGPGQISTEAKADANTGILSREILENRLGNSQFQFDKVATQFPSWTIYDAAGVGFLPNANIIQTDYIADSTLITGGPGALTGVKLTPIAAQTVGVTKFYAEIDRKLKPNTFYGLSFWYKVDTSDWNCQVRFGINASNGGAAASLITTGSPTGLPLDFFIIPDGAWHRGSIVVQTKDDGSVSPINTYYMEIRIDAPNALRWPAGSLATPITITSVQLTEGEWITGYIGSQYVPSGAILLWNKPTTCPPGYHEVTDARDKFFVGADTVAAGAFGGPNFNPIGSLGFTDPDNVNHTHGIPSIDTGDEIVTGLISPLGVAFGAAFGGPQPLVNKHKHAGGAGNTGGESNQHQHNLPGSIMPYYGLKLCQAL